MPGLFPGRPRLVSSECKKEVDTLDEKRSKKGWAREEEDTRREKFVGRQDGNLGHFDLQTFRTQWSAQTADADRLRDLEKRGHAKSLLAARKAS